MNADAGPVRLLDRGGNLGPRRVDHRDQPGQAQLALGVLAPVRDSLPGGQVPVGEREHPQAAGGVVIHRTDDRVAVPG